jgi:dCMP deaminase
LPSRAVHAEANAIAQAAKHGIATDGASIYVTLEPCLYCLKLIISAGIRTVFYEVPFMKDANAAVRDSFIQERLVTINQIELSPGISEKAALSLLQPTSVKQPPRIKLGDRLQDLI